MNNTCTVSMKSAGNTVDYTKKASLLERFKKYLLENSEMICGGIIAMNGGTYIPRRYER